MNHPIYLDAHATTPCDPRVVEAMLPTFTEDFGNAASRQHAFGWRAEALVEQARALVADLIAASSEEIVFTSGATESDNLAILGAARAYASKGRHLVTSAIEHRAVLDSLARLEREGFTVTRIAPAPDGVTPAEAVAAALTSETILVSIMAANNEIGVINPIASIGALCKRHGAIFHCDAVQALPWMALDVQAAGIDLLSVSAHKFYGPKGVGALYVRRRAPRVRLEPIMEGGGHERGLRPGTLNVSGIVGLGRAAELARAERETDAARVGRLRDRLLTALRTGLAGIRINGAVTDRLPNNLNISFEGVDGAALFAGLKDLAVSSGAACSTADAEPSHVLQALGLSDALAAATIRFGLSRFTTAGEIDAAAAQVISEVAGLRSEARLL